MSDRIVITMPMDTMQFLIALAVAQELQMHLHLGAEKQTRDSDFTVTFRLNEKFKFIEPCMKVLKNMSPIFDYTEWYELGRGEYDCFVEFDFERARFATLKNKKHITEGFGALLGTYINAIMYGVVPQRQPILKPLMLPKGPGGVLVIEWDEAQTKKFVRYLCNNYPELAISVAKIQSYELEDLIKYINDFDVVIGQYSCITYIAASLEKPLIEVFKSEDEYALYSNEPMKMYSAMLGDVTAEYMFAVWEDLWQRFQDDISVTSYQGLVQQTAQDQSTVPVVEEKSSDNPVP